MKFLCQLEIKRTLCRWNVNNAERNKYNLKKAIFSDGALQLLCALLLRFVVLQGQFMCCSFQQVLSHHGIDLGAAIKTKFNCLLYIY